MKPYSWGRRLKQARVAAGISQKRLGILAGIDEAVASARINRYERGVHAPDLAIACALANALNVFVAFFYTPEDDLAEYIYRLSALKHAERRELMRDLAYVPGPPDVD